MKSFFINNDTLASMARVNNYNWMNSLRFVRNAYNAHKAVLQNCGCSEKTKPFKLDLIIVAKTVNDPTFKAELMQLKAKMDWDLVQVVTTSQQFSV